MILRDNFVEEYRFRGKSLSHAAFMDTVREKIIDAGLRAGICGDCCWNDLCKRKEEALKGETG